MTAEEILERAESQGFELRVTPEGGVAARPASVPEEIKNAIRAHRTEVVELLLLRARHGGETVDRFAGLRRFAPSLFNVARTKDGRDVLVWGVTPHGVIVSPAPGKPLLTLSPSEFA